MAKGWSTREAAEAAKVSASLVSRVENGHDVGFRAGISLARAYGLCANSLPT
jgi:transcriptional regulator with XRE-family HTH domain